MAVVVSMEMCVQNLYLRSLELPRIREKLSLNYEPLKRLRYEQFSTLLSSARDQLTPSSGRSYVSLERRSHVSRFAGAGKRGNEFPRENVGIMDTSCVASVFRRSPKQRVPSFNDTRDISYFTLIFTCETLLYNERKDMPYELDLSCEILHAFTMRNKFNEYQKISDIAWNFRKYITCIKVIFSY